MRTYSDHELHELVSDPNSGIAGDLAALLSDARQTVRESIEALEMIEAKIASVSKRWLPLSVSDLVPGDIFKIDGNPVHVVAIVNHSGAAQNILIVNDHYRDQVLSKRWMVEAWR